MDKDKLRDSLLRAMVGGTLDRRPRDPAGFPIDVNRPAIPNPMIGGGRSTEFTRSYDIGDREYDVPSISGGEFLPGGMSVFAALLRSENNPMGLQDVPNFPIGQPRIPAGSRSEAIWPARETNLGTQQALNRINPYRPRR